MARRLSRNSIELESSALRVKKNRPPPTSRSTASPPPLVTSPAHFSMREVTKNPSRTTSFHMQSPKPGDLRHLLSHNLGRRSRRILRQHCGRRSLGLAHRDRSLPEPISKQLAINSA